MPDSKTAFFEAAEKGDIAALKQNLQNGTDINAVNHLGRTAILLAAMNKHYEAVQFLIDSGADINRQDQTCFNPFLWGCLNDDLTLVKLMVKAKPDLTLVTRFGGVGITPAAEKGHVEIVRELLETTDINYNHTNAVGWTPLLEAIVLNDGGKKHQEIVRLLLKHGANPNMTDKYGKTPLTLAKEKGYEQIVELLVAGGAT